MTGFIVYIIVSIITPGPNNLFASASSATSSFRKTHPFMVGIWIGTTIVFLITSYINVYFYKNFEIITRIIGVLGGLFIVYLALRLFIGRNNKDKGLIHGKKLFFMAIIMNFLNAKTIIFGITVSTYYLSIGLPIASIYYFSFLMGFLCYIAVMLWGIFGSTFKTYLHKHQMVYTIVMSLLLCYSGVLVIVESIFQ